MAKFDNPTEIIDALGGSAKVSRDLGYREESGLQRVNNWKKRGIAAKALLDNLEYFERARKMIARKP
jgi:hypothetical protein